jgi:sugar phosphate isomerase/epimerase
MKLGIFTPVFGKLSFEQMLAKVKSLGGIGAVELGTGGWPGRDHIDMDSLLANQQAARDYRSRVCDAGLTISALSCHGNAIHPDAETARKYNEIFRNTVRLAQLLEVPVVNTFSGCPGDSENARCPNWITTPWPPEFLETLDWQWEKRVIPYWREAGKFAADYGIKVALEAHPGFCVYNVETALRLRAAAGKSIGVNFDPSHLFWQGVDIPVAIRALGEAIFHVHAKDVAFDGSNVACNGVLDAKSYRRMAERSWLFRTVGWGHDELEWKRIVSALRMAKYDYVMSIEHEDALASIDEGLSSAVSFLNRVLLSEPPADAWWT